MCGGEKRGFAEESLQRLTACIDRGLDLVADAQAEVRRDVKKVQAVAETLDPAKGTLDERRGQFERLRRRFSRQTNDVAQQMVKLMIRFAPGLFVGPVADLPEDNLDLER